MYLMKLNFEYREVDLTFKCSQIFIKSSLAKECQGAFFEDYEYSLSYRTVIFRHLLCVRCQGKPVLRIAAHVPENGRFESVCLPVQIR